MASDTHSAPAHVDARGAAGASEEEAIIRTAGLTKVYAEADFAAVDGLDLEIRAGEIFGLLGAQRRGQDDHRGDAHHARDPHRGDGLRWAPST